MSTLRRTIQRRKQKALARLREATTDAQRARIGQLIEVHDRELAKLDDAGPVPPDRAKRRVQESRWKALSRLRRTRTPERRAELERLIESHDAKLAAMDDGLKRCGRCKARLEPSDANFRTKSDGSGKLHSECRGCDSARSAEGYARKALSEPVKPRAKPGPKPNLDGLKAEEVARAEREREIRILIARYEAIRPHPGPDRTAAYNALGLALSRHGRPVSDGVREWEWSRGMGEVTSRLIRRLWREPEDKNASPRRIARDEMLTRSIDLVEM